MLRRLKLWFDAMELVVGVTPLSDTPATQYVSGYECPTCGTRAVGVPERAESEGRRVSWSFRFAVTLGTLLYCYKCGTLVPRECWTFVTTGIA